jgi:hypothetical protein
MLQFSQNSLCFDPYNSYLHSSSLSDADILITAIFHASKATFGSFELLATITVYHVAYLLHQIVRIHMDKFSTLSALPAAPIHTYLQPYSEKICHSVSTGQAIKQTA